MPEQFLADYIVSRVVPGKIYRVYILKVFVVPEQFLAEFIVSRAVSWIYCRWYNVVVTRVVPGFEYEIARVVPGIKYQ